MSRTALYRFYDDHGDLLYVGISVTPWARWKQHKGAKDWAEDVTTTQLEWFDSRPEALAAEKAAIVAEEPRYNIQHSTLRSTATPVPELRVAAICTVCERQIRGLGTVQIDLDKVTTAQDRPSRRWVSAEELMALEFPSWEVLHFECDPDPDRRLYVIDIDDLRTLGGLLEVTAHLMEKPWIGLTDWSDIVRRITTGDGTGPLLIPEQFL